MTSPLHGLPRAALDDLAAALVGGRLRLPPNAQQLRGVLDAASVGAVCVELARMAALGMTAVHIAEVLSLLSAQQRRTEQARDAVRLVWSGPERGARETRETSVVIQELFHAAREELLIATYAIHDGDVVFHDLAQRMQHRPALRVRIVLHVHWSPQGAAHAIHDAWHAFAAQWPSGARRPALFYDDRSVKGDGHKRASMHAKFVVADDERAFVTSANFTEAAQERNVEAGVLIEQPAFARALRQHVDTLIEQRLLVPLLPPA